MVNAVRVKWSDYNLTSLLIVDLKLRIADSHTVFLGLSEYLAVSPIREIKAYPHPQYTIYCGSQKIKNKKKP